VVTVVKLEKTWGKIMDAYLLLLVLFLIVLIYVYFIGVNRFIRVNRKQSRRQYPDSRAKSEQRINFSKLLAEDKYSTDEKRAIELYELAIKKEWEGDYEGALADLDEVIQFDPRWSTAYHNSRAIILTRMGRLEQALQSVNQAIEESPSIDTWYITRSTIHRRMGNPQAAISDASKAISIATSVYKSNAMQLQVANSGKSDLDYAYISRGNARTKLQDYKGAIDDFTQAINLSPEAGQGYYGRGCAKKALGDIQDAISDFEKAAEIYAQRGYLAEYQDAAEQISLLKGE
jgi:tetratricopeptide (TPR) repeat protein